MITLNFEMWIIVGIIIVIMLLINYLIIIRTWLNFIHDQRMRNEMYQKMHLEALERSKDEPEKFDKFENKP